MSRLPVFVARRAVPALPTSTFPTPPTAPQAPITTITNAPTLGLNVYNAGAATYTDYVIDGCGDSAVLIHGSSNGASLKRSRLLNVSSLNAVPYGKHAVYAKAMNLTLEDIYATCSVYAASGFSMRMAGSVVRRTEIGTAASEAGGAPFHAYSCYQQDATAGTMLAEEAKWYTKDAAIYIGPPDGPSVCNLSFTFRNIVAFSAINQFLSVNVATFTGSILLQNCWLNGSRVVSGNCYPVGSIPNLTIVS